MRALIWIGLIIGVGIFFWQNPQPVMLSFLGGSVKMQLPLAAWVFVFTVAGAFSSVLVLGLNSTSSKRSPQAPPFQTKTARPSPQPPFSPEISSREVNRPSSDFSSDWQSALPAEQQEAWDDWEAETPAAAASSPPKDTVVKPPMQERRPEIERAAPPTLRNFEVSQQAEGISQEGSVYSYRYRKAQEDLDPTPSATESVPERPDRRSISEESEQRPRKNGPEKNGPEKNSQAQSI